MGGVGCGVGCGVGWGVGWCGVWGGVWGGVEWLGWVGWCGCPTLNFELYPKHCPLKASEAHQKILKAPRLRSILLATWAARPVVWTRLCLS